MTETFAALFFAHVLADFVFQTNWIAGAKAARHPGAMILHVGTVAIASALALGAPTQDALMAVAVLTGLHLAIDIAKTFAPPGLGPFLTDQALHLVTITAVAAWIPGLWAQGYWSGQAWLPGLMVLVAGAVLATRAGGFALAMLMQPWADVRLDGLPGGGRIIGYLERGMIFVLILTGQAGGIGFLIAAKSVLRFGAVKEEARLGEYVIVGTLASFGWAIVMATGTAALLAALPPLGIPDLSP